MTLDNLCSLLDAQSSQKEVAAKVAEWLNEHSAEDATKFATIESKLSKLRNGNSEGKTFFCHGRRLDALAHVLGVQVAALRSIFERFTFLLDPRLPMEVVNALQRQQEASDAPVDFLETSVEGDRPQHEPAKRGRVSGGYVANAKALLRAEAEKHPEAIIVLAQDDDLSWFEGAKRKTTHVSKVRRGYALTGFPTLLPVPAPAPPDTWIAKIPKISHPDLTTAVRACIERAGIVRERLNEGSGVSWPYNGPKVDSPFWLSDPERFRSLAHECFEADEEEKEPAFRLSYIHPWLKTRMDPDSVVHFGPETERDEMNRPRSFVPDAPTPTLSDVLEGPKETYVWWRGKEIFAWGPQAENVAKVFGPHHSVSTAFPELQQWAAALQRRNPFTNAFEALETPLRERTGIALEQARQAWCRGVGTYGCPDVENNRYRIVPGTEDELFEARRSLMDLANREMRLLQHELTLPVRLAHAARSPLVLLPKAKFDHLHVLACMGAGRTMLIHVVRFEEPNAQPLVSCDDSYKDRGIVLDGGDVRVWIHHLYDAQLEGLYLPGGERRSEEDAIARPLAEEAARRGVGND